MKTVGLKDNNNKNNYYNFYKLIWRMCDDHKNYSDQNTSIAGGGREEGGGRRGRQTHH